MLSKPLPANEQTQHYQTREINRETESEKNKVKEKKNEKRTDIHKCWVIRITKNATANQNTHGAGEQSSESEKNGSTLQSTFLLRWNCFV